MTRLRILVEGDTEEEFVGEVLGPHLAEFGITVTATGLAGTRGGRGVVKWSAALRNIRNSLKEDSELRLTTLVDYYGLGQDWPGRGDAKSVAPDRRAEFLAGRIREELRREFGDSTAPDRFIPFVMIHEFEALLFGDPQAAERGISQSGLAGELTKILESFRSPEEINDRYDTCPSRRLVRLFIEKDWGRYEKPLHGNLAILEAGIGKLRRSCPQFGAWVRQLESLGKPPDKP